MEPEEARSHLHKALDEVKSANEEAEDAFLVNWVVVGEWMGSDGNKFLTRITSDGMTSYLLAGMLAAAR